jgi:3-hydroxyethyl bacteriochlorophyllide a dehydrogenase
VAVILSNPGAIEIRSVALDALGPDDIVVEISHTGISTGTEKLFWSGTMPSFPGIGYPLIPGYEAVGEVVQAGAGSSLRTGDRVFVPGASCYGPVRGLFGGAARRMVTHPDRALKVDAGLGPDATLVALAATARHAIAGVDRSLPDLVVGHGVLGRLLARLTIAAGGTAPTVWEINPERRTGAAGYDVLDPDEDPRRDYRCIYDATGDARLLDTLVGRIAKGGEIVLAGFYAQPLTFAFPPAFMKEARLRIAAEWTRDDLIATRALIECGALSLDGLITHEAPAADAPAAYARAFTDPACLKMTLDWGAIA